MLKNYFLTALRHIQKQKSASIINIVGLTLGITCCLYIFLFVFDELKYDQFHLNKERIFRVLVHNVNTNEKSAILPAVIFEQTKNSIPEFEKGFRICGNPNFNFALCYKENLYTDKIYFADQDILSLLNFPLERGNPATALKDPFSIVITSAIAEKYFGKENPLGKALTYENMYEFKVTGILKELPQNSHIKVSLIASLNSFNTIEPFVMNDTRASNSTFYFLLKKKASVKNAENAVTQIYKDNVLNNTKDKSVKLVLEPLNKIYLYSTDTSWDLAEHGDINIVKGFIVIALLIMLMAVFNFTNLLAAYVKLREKEISVRKLLGAGKKAIVNQFLFETLLFLLVSFLVSLVLTDLFIDEFNELTGKQLNLSSLLSIENLLSISLLLFLVTITSVIYPSLIATRSSFIERLKASSYNSRFKPVHFTFGFRQVVTGIQFIITIALIAAVLVIYNQMIYINKARLGFNKEQLITIQNPYGEKMYDNYQNYKNKINQYPEVISVSASANIPGRNINNYTQVWLKGKSLKESKKSGHIAVDYDIFKTWQTKIVDGRDFSREMSTDLENAVIINKQAAALLGLKDPVGTEVEGINNTSGPQKVIGVVENIHFKSLKEKTEPIIFYLRQWSAQYIVVRLSTKDLPTALANLEDEWKNIMPDRPFIYNFADDSFDKLYTSEQRTAKLILIFSFLAITISSVGLLGLITLLSQMRKKEIGIRKVLGASITRILTMIIQEYAYVIIAANIIAIPLSYYFLNGWLERFVYRINMEYWMFAAAGIISLFIGIIVVSIKGFLAATANPVESLKCE